MKRISLKINNLRKTPFLPMHMLLVYIICSDSKEAQTVGTHLLKKRLCACINILPHVESLCFWPPNTETLGKNKETVLLVKTLNIHYKEIEMEVEKLHSYDTVCIFGLPIMHVSKKYLSWLKNECSKKT